MSNFAMPLIRFDTKDTATYTFNAKNRKRKIMSLDGRSEDYICLPNGVKVGRLDYIFKDTVNISEAQLHQNADYSIIIYAVKAVEDVSKDEKMAMELLRAYLGNEISIRFEYVDRIARSNGGKLRFVISNIK